MINRLGQSENFLFSRDHAGCSMGGRLEGMSVGGRRRSSCAPRDGGGFDWSGVGADGERWGCFHVSPSTRVGIESVSSGIQSQED